MATNKDVLRRLDVLESEAAIRRLMAEYLAARDFDPNKGQHIASLFTEEGVWEAVGLFAEILGSYHGREAIERRFSRPMPFSLHLAANESITVDGDQAQGVWSFLQPTTINRQAAWVAGRYLNAFVRVAGRWKFQHIQIDGVFFSPYEDGWAKTPLWSL